MAPPSATATEIEISTETLPIPKEASQRSKMDPAIVERQIKSSQMNFPQPPKFDDPYQEREYQKGRLALAFRIFAKFGFDEGVAGHITLRVSCDKTLR